jgi:hypothetical protein
MTTITFDVCGFECHLGDGREGKLQAIMINDEFMWTGLFESSIENIKSKIRAFFPKAYRTFKKEKL